MATRIPSSYVIRQLKPADAPLLRTFRLEALATSPDSFTSTVSREQSFTMDIWEERTARTAFVFERATSPGNDSGDQSNVQEPPVGMVGYYWAEQGETPTAILASLWVHPAHRGKGLGSALVEWVVGRVLPTGTGSASPRRRLQLDVDERNKKVIPMYERLGFRKLETDGLFMEYSTYHVHESEVRHLDDWTLLRPFPNTYTNVNTLYVQNPL
ncbi:hypothetical protein FRC00_000884 [Tulasnella sp. 408]|nr:hypothetical protein FRC00_000884 [Tulasnella sp. 408]